jgi:succinate-semialdehyde dehydrogenase/glutarate-semialdehyde dehydrogenase
METEQERLGQLMTWEQGKPLQEARGEVAYAASFIDWAAEEGKRIYGETIPASHPNKRIIVLRQPVGVCAAITPWNFPAAMITRKLGPALAAGCTLVIKPAEQTPLTALALGELCLEAGVPPGVVNIITGDPQAIGKELLENSTVRKLSFTGSTEVGRLLVKLSAQNLTRLSLELGGHAPFIVFADADLDRAVEALMVAKFRNMGQTCICANRVLVEASVHAEFSERLVAAVARLRIGCGSDEGVQVGPLIDDQAVRKVESHVSDAVSKGAKIEIGGQRTSVPGLSDRFYAPTVLSGVTKNMLIFEEETFGPVCPLLTFQTEAEAISLANDSPYGLAAYFFTKDASRLMRVAEALDYGILGVNDGSPSTAQAPFGGMKHSGFGREGGHHVMHEYLEVKYLSWGL